MFLPQHECASQRTALCSQLSPPTLKWVPGHQVCTVSAHWAISPCPINVILDTGLLTLIVSHPWRLPMCFSSRSSVTRSCLALGRSDSYSPLWHQGLLWANVLHLTGSSWRTLVFIWWCSFGDLMEDLWTGKDPEGSNKYNSLSDGLLLGTSVQGQSRRSHKTAEQNVTRHTWVKTTFWWWRVLGLAPVRHTKELTLYIKIPCLKYSVCCVSATSPGHMWVPQRSHSLQILHRNPCLSQQLGMTWPTIQASPPSCPLSPWDVPDDLLKNQPSHF